MLLCLVNIPPSMARPLRSFEASRLLSLFDDDDFSSGGGGPIADEIMASTSEGRGGEWATRLHGSGESRRRSQEDNGSASEASQDPMSPLNLSCKRIMLPGWILYSARVPSS